MRMSKAWKWKAASAFIVTLLGVYFVLPSFLSEEASEQYKSYLPSSKINLGLDLQGGIHMVLGVDVNRVVLDEADNYAIELEEMFERESIALESIQRGFSDTKINIKLSEASDYEKVETLLYERINAQSSVLETFGSNPAEGEMQLRLSSMRKAEIEQRAPRDRTG